MRYTQELCSRLSAHGIFRPTLICPEGYVSALAGRGPGYEVIEVGGIDFSRSEASRFNRYGRLAPVMRGFANKHAFGRFYEGVHAILRARDDMQVLHLMDYDYLVLARFMNRIRSEKGRAKVAVTVHTADFQPRGYSVAETYKRLVRRSFRNVLMNSAAVITHSAWIGDALRGQLHIPDSLTGRFVTAPYGAEGRDGRIDQKQARQRLGIPPDAPVALWFGMLRKDKRPDLAIQAAARGPANLWLILAGSCEAVGEAQVRAWVAQAGMAERCVLRLRYIPEGEIPLYYSAADVFLTTHHSAYGATSGPLNDCRTYRLPAIVSNVGALAEYVGGHGVGLLAEPGNPESFGEKLRTYFSLQTLKRTEIIENIEKSAAKYSWEYMCSRHEEAYRLCMDPE
jgi:glycosyltransferase involved in cell wall biosynthesis